MLGFAVSILEGEVLVAIKAVYHNWEIQALFLNTYIFYLRQTLFFINVKEKEKSLTRKSYLGSSKAVFFKEFLVLKFQPIAKFIFQRAYVNMYS